MVAIIGSRNLLVRIEDYVPEEMTEIVTGGAPGVDRCAEKYADDNDIPKMIVKPEYKKYGRRAPLVRNEIIVDCAELVVAIWDGKSKGTKYAIDYAKKRNKPVNVHII